MFKIQKRLEIAGSHCLDLPYDSKCNHIHGHNWIITVHCQAQTLNDNDMIVDFSEVKRLIHDKLDHKHINDVLAFRPTAERIAEWVVNTVPSCYRADVQESEGNTATYEIQD